jgi:diguanylate cyclase (GGDEF)-like protein
VEDFAINIAGILVISVLIFAFVEISKHKREEKAARERHATALTAATQLLAGALMVDSPLLVAIRDSLSAAVPITDIALWDDLHEIGTFGNKHPKRSPTCTIPLPNGGEIKVWVPINDLGAPQFSEEAKSLIEQILPWLSASLIASAAYLRIRKEASTDPLTGLGNRRLLYFERRRHSETNSRIGIALVDINNLKTVNDTYGHKAGDALIKGVAQLLSDVTRTEDTVVRMGGDEFLIIARGASNERLKSLKQRLRHLVSTASIPVGPNKSISIGVAIGLASLPDDTKDWEELLSIADAKMYVDKQSQKKAGVSMLNGA